MLQASDNGLTGGETMSRRLMRLSLRRRRWTRVLEKQTQRINAMRGAFAVSRPYERGVPARGRPSNDRTPPQFFYLERSWPPPPSRPRREQMSNPVGGLRHCSMLRSLPRKAKTASAVSPATAQPLPRQRAIGHIRQDLRGLFGPGPGPGSSAGARAAL